MIVAIDLNKYHSERQKNVRSVPQGKKENTNNGSFLDTELSFSSKVSDKKKERLYQDLHNLVGSGVDLRTSLELVSAEVKSKAYKKLLEDIRKDVESGKELWEAMENTQKFTDFELKSVEIGERSATLSPVFENLKTYFAARIQIKRQLTGALMYPAFVLLAAFGVMYFMLTSIVPMFSDIFGQFNKELPSETLMVIAASDFVNENLTIIIASFVLPLAFLYFVRKTLIFRKISSTFIMSIPFFGSSTRKIYHIRFTRFLYLLTSAHTPLIKALELVKDVIGSYPFEKSLDSIIEEVRKGGTLSDGLSKYKIYDRRMVSLLRVAEQNNSLAPTLKSLAEQYDEEVQHRMKLTGKMIEPVIILIIGGFIAVILVAMYSPLFNLGNALEP